MPRHKAAWLLRIRSTVRVRQWRLIAAGIAVEIDQTVTLTIGLVKPDGRLVIHAEVPERVDRAVGVEGHRQADALVLARAAHFALKERALDRVEEGLADVARSRRRYGCD